jgi:DNA polymerase/3'-5' exonuclease PolX
MTALAASLCAELSPFCHRLAIAGSVRRRQRACGDIEIVCEPRSVPVAGDDLFRATTVNRLDEQCRLRLTRGEWQQGGAFGSRYKRLILVQSGVQLDLFSVLPPAQWGCILLIRTGPADFSRRYVTPREKGGWLPDDCFVDRGTVWRRHRGVSLPPPGERSVRHERDPTAARVEIPDEAAFFALCGRAYVPPQERS